MKLQGVKKSMKKILITLAILGLIATGSLKAEAFFLVDTGTPTNNTPLLLSTDQWLAARFSLAQAETITGMSGWMEGVTGSLTMIIYGDNSPLPDTSDEIFAQSFNVSGAGADTYDWFGLSGLNLNLNSGNYWIAFEVRDGSDTYTGSMDTGAPTPLTEEAFFNRVQNFDYLSINDFQSTFDLGIQITAADPLPPTVPEPMTMATITMGLLGAAYTRRKKQA